MNMNHLSYFKSEDQIKNLMILKKIWKVNRQWIACVATLASGTEIAIRAAFKAVADNKQVAVLVPTTILALQHSKTFQKRLKNFP